MTTTQGNTEKKYSFATATRVGEVLGQVNGVDVYGVNATVIGFAAGEPEIGQTNDGHKVVNVSLPLNNTGKKITGSVGFEDPADETLWVRVAFFDGEHSNLATRAEKAIAKGKLLIVNGYLKPREYEGKVFYDMSAHDFKISWSKEKGKTVGGEYSWVSARKANKEGVAVTAFESFVGSDPQIDTTPNGKKVISFRVGLNKAESKLNYPLGIEKNETPSDVTWVTVNAWEDSGNLFGRVEKAIKKGQGIVGHGLMTSTPGEKGNFYNLNLRDFEIVRGAGEKNGGGTGETVASEQPVVNIEVDDDIPF